MRGPKTYTDPNGNYTIQYTYPDEYTWINDNIFIKINKVSGPLIFTIKVTLGVYPNTIDMAYTTKANSIVFDLTDNIRQLFTGSPTSIPVKITFPQYPIGEIPFNVNVLEGKTFPTKPHGSSDVILIHNVDELSGVDIYLPFASVGSISDTTITQSENFKSHDLSSVITDPGEYIICFSPAKVSTLPPIVNWISDQYLTPYSSDIVWESVDQEVNDTYQEGVWKCGDSQEKCIKIIYEEPCCPSMEIMYYNSDGCKRYLNGKILVESDSATWNDCPHKFNEVSYQRKYYINENSKIVRLGFHSIPSGLEVNDIAYSRGLWFRDYKNEWTPCIIRDINISNKNNDDELILEIVTNKY